MRGKTDRERMYLLVCVCVHIVCCVRLFVLTCKHVRVCVTVFVFGSDSPIKEFHCGPISAREQLLGSRKPLLESAPALLGHTHTLTHTRTHHLSEPCPCPVLLSDQGEEETDQPGHTFKWVSFFLGSCLFFLSLKLLTAFLGHFP